jgi:hypothetical protein
MGPGGTVLRPHIQTDPENGSPAPHPGAEGQETRESPCTPVYIDEDYQIIYDNYVKTIF